MDVVVGRGKTAVNMDLAGLADVSETAAKDMIFQVMDMMYQNPMEVVIVELAVAIVAYPSAVGQTEVVRRIAPFVTEMQVAHQSSVTDVDLASKIASTRPAAAAARVLRAKRR